LINKTVLVGAIGFNAAQMNMQDESHWSQSYFASGHLLASLNVIGRLRFEPITKQKFPYWKATNCDLPIGSRF
jgi:hypothetical protein